MATFYLQNDCYVNTPDMGMILFRAGRIVDSDALSFPLQLFIDAGASLIPTSNAQATFNAAVARKYEARGSNLLVDPNAPVPVTDAATQLPNSSAANQFLTRPFPPGNGTPAFVNVTQDMIAAAFTIALIHTPSVVEVGVSVATPAFTATYNRPPSAAVLTDSVGTTPQNVISTPTAFNSTGTFAQTALNASVTFSLTANETGGPSKVSNSTIAWQPRVFHGVAVAGVFNEAFIEALASQPLQPSRVTTYSDTAGVNQHFYFAAPSAYGTPTFTVGGFSGGFHLAAAAVSVTNGFGVTMNYDLWESDNVELGLLVVQVT